MTAYLAHDFDFATLDRLVQECVAIKDQRGLSADYWAARAALDREAARLDSLRCADARAVVERLGYRLASWRGTPL